MSSQQVNEAVSKSALGFHHARNNNDNDNDNNNKTPPENVRSTNFLERYPPTPPLEPIQPKPWASPRGRYCRCISRKLIDPKVTRSDPCLPTTLPRDCPCTYIILIVQSRFSHLWWLMAFIGRWLIVCLNPLFVPLFTWVPLESSLWCCRWRQH